MTEREMEILNILRENPMISQNDIAERLGIRRSSVGVHILNLTRKGHVKGKGYILSDGPYVAVIGGSNVDITGIPHKKLSCHDSTPGRVTLTSGGVARNIAENLARLDVDCRLFSAVGRDVHGKKILSDCTTAGVNVTHVATSTQRPTSTYLSILEGDGEMQYAVSDMEVLSEVDRAFIEKRQGVLSHASAVVIDTNLDEETIDSVIRSCKNTPVFADPVSVTKAEKLRNHLAGIHTLKPNRMEAEVLTGFSITSEKDLGRAADFFLTRGVKQVFISLGTQGIYYANGAGKSTLKSDLHSVVNTTGAGDAFMAGLVFSHLKNFTLDDSAAFSSGAACLTLQSSSAVNCNISESAIQALTRTLKENK